MRTVLLGSTAGLWARLSATPARPRDWVLAAIVATAHLAPIRSGATADPTEPWAGVVVAALAIGSGLALVWRRSHPLAVAAVVLACYAGLALIQGLVPPYAAWVAIWSLATSGRQRREDVTHAAATAAATSALLIAAELTRPGVGAVALLVAFTMLIALAAVLVRSERARVVAVGRRAATEERLRIARDLHDLVGHGLSTIAVQSSTARMALAADDPATAVRALSAVESSSRTAMREMRQMLGVLADEESSGVRASAEPSPPQQPSPGLAEIPALVDNVRAAGVAVTLEQEGAWRSASPAAQLCAYRVVQEGLTNAVKHAPGAMVSVRLTAGLDGEGRVAVETTGTSPPPAHGKARTSARGRGLDGLRTRVAASGGVFACSPTDHGWLIEARLPLRDEADR